MLYESFAFSVRVYGQSVGNSIQYSAYAVNRRHFKVNQFALLHPNRVAYMRGVLAVGRENRVVSSKLGGLYERYTSYR